MSSFISIDHLSTADFSSQSIVIDGQQGSPTPTFFRDGSAIQLRRARQEESGFDWENSVIRNVTIKNVIIFDKTDINCLQWFILNGFKLDLSEAYISPESVDKFEQMCTELKQVSCKVVAGSQIRFSYDGGMYQEQKQFQGRRVAKEIGFQTGW